MAKNKFSDTIWAYQHQAMRAGRWWESCFCNDILQIAMGRLGWGEKRLRELEKVYSEAYEEYDALHEQDGKDDLDNEYFKACIDRELQRYTGASFVPFDERHGLKKRGAKR